MIDATKFRDWKRKLIAERYRRKNGDLFERGGALLTIPAHIHPNIRYLLAKGRPYEAEETAFFKQVAKTGTPVIELGGSLGVVSAMIRTVIGPDARHVIVEAKPDLAEICRQNASLAATQGATEVIQGAIAYTDAKAVRFASGENEHAGHIAEDGDTDGFDAPVIRLAELVAKMPKELPHVLMCDIEGGELDMIRHEPAATFQNTSHAILEIHPGSFIAQGSSETAFFDLMADKGFTSQSRLRDVILFKGPAG